ncbi:MAG TPA: M6 family metalloprotease domain-containing protein [bacterium]|nr:M6 family metalloprotease domain-containing protein [bacterium]HPN45169.1 M6 family metalloprotease domain-containing protein [bacterium]
MKKIFLVIILLPAFVYAIAPPREATVRIPADMLQNITRDPVYYRAKRGFQQTMRMYRSQTLAGGSSPDYRQAPVTVDLPVLCVRFADVKREEWPIADLQQMLFGAWPTGSMQDYYREVSYSRFIPDGDVYGWYQATGNSVYYERERGNAGELLKEALTFFDTGIDFSLYDNDGSDGIPNSGDDDGYVDVVILVHSGVGAEEAGGPEIWSHFSQYSKLNGDCFTTNDSRASGETILIDDYMIVPAMQQNDMVSIGVFCHEFGHALGLPDLYDRDYSSAGVGIWCVMGYGSWGGNGKSPQTPVHFSAWCKQALGWVTPLILTENLDDMPVPACETEPVVYKLWTKGQIAPFIYQNDLGLVEQLGREYFLLENRQKHGFDSNLPGEGFLLWHVDNSLSYLLGNDFENHKFLDLEEADGQDDLDCALNRGNAGDIFPGAANNRNFNRTSLPNSLGYDGKPSKIAVENIHRDGSAMIANIQAFADDIACDGYYLNQDTLRKYLNPGETINLYIRLKNYGGYINALNAQLSSDDPALHIADAQAVYKGIGEDEIQANVADPFVITLAAGTIRHPLLCKLHLAADNGYTITRDVIIYMENNRILLVDDSQDETDKNGKRIVNYYRDALNGIDYVEYDVWSVKDKQNPTRYDMIPYGVIIWFTGSQKATFTPNEMANFRYLMYSGWKLLLCGQNIGKQMANGDDVQRSFLRDWMHARLLTDNVPVTGVLRISGLAGDPISDEFRPYFYAAGGDGAGNQVSPGAVAPDSLAEPFLTYTDLEIPGQCAATRYNGKYKLVYYAFSLEAVNNKHSGYDVRRKLLEKTLEWLQGSVKTAVEETNALTGNIPDMFELAVNFPNPFNSTTTITYTLPAAGVASLYIYNVCGQKIATLHEERQPAGSYCLTWNGLAETGVPATSGIYFYTLTVGNRCETKKMILLR